MKRNKEWRLFQKDKKFKKIYKYVIRDSQFELELNAFKLFNHEIIFSYKHKSKNNEDVTIDVDSYEKFKEFINERTKKVRDNAKKCSCDMCCNPRHSFLSKNKEKLTLQERKNLEYWNYIKNNLNDYLI